MGEPTMHEQLPLALQGGHAREQQQNNYQQQHRVEMEQHEQQLAMRHPEDEQCGREGGEGQGGEEGLRGEGHEHEHHPHQQQQLHGGHFQGSQMMGLHHPMNTHLLHEGHPSPHIHQQQQQQQLEDEEDEMDEEEEEGLMEDEDGNAQYAAPGNGRSVGAMQLTLSYQGEVYVFDTVPPEKVQAVLLLLGGREIPPGMAGMPPSGPMFRDMFQKFGPDGSPRLNLSQRLASLTRFREKRKERCYDKKIRYSVRKEVAQRMHRKRGQFATSRPGADGSPGPSGDESLQGPGKEHGRALGFLQQQQQQQQQHLALGGVEGPPGSLSGAGFEATCSHCGTGERSTPMMRRGPAGPRTLCNACGLMWANKGVLRDLSKAPAPSASASPLQAHPHPHSHPHSHPQPHPQLQQYEPQYQQQQHQQQLLPPQSPAHPPQSPQSQMAPPHQHQILAHEIHSQMHLPPLHMVQHQHQHQHQHQQQPQPLAGFPGAMSTSAGPGEGRAGLAEGGGARPGQDGAHTYPQPVDPSRTFSQPEGVFTSSSAFLPLPPPFPPSLPAHDLPPPASSHYPPPLPPPLLSTAPPTAPALQPEEVEAQPPPETGGEPHPRVRGTAPGLGPGPGLDGDGPSAALSLAPPSPSPRQQQQAPEPPYVPPPLLDRDLPARPRLEERAEGGEPAKEQEHTHELEH